MPHTDKSVTSLRDQSKTTNDYIGHCRVTRLRTGAQQPRFQASHVINLLLDWSPIFHLNGGGNERYQRRTV